MGELGSIRSVARQRAERGEVSDDVIQNTNTTQEEKEK
jgi:hypothetical protein